MRPLLPACLLAVCVHPILAQTKAPVISEFVAANALSLVDQDGDDSDWIEIHNPGTNILNIGGYALSDDLGKARKWIFPNPTWVGAGGYLLVFASQKDRRVSGQQLHTNFKLKSAGEHLGLYDPSGRPVSSHGAMYPPQYTDVSYGFEFNPKLTGNRVYFGRPTPGKANGHGSVLITESSHSPQALQANQDCLITATLQNPNQLPLNSVDLKYRVGFGSEIGVVMRDDGKGGDLQANDGHYTARIPSSRFNAGEMLRWRIEAWPANGAGTYSPLFLSSNNSPEYYGTMVLDPNVQHRIPVFHWWTNNPSGATTVQGARCSVSFLGEFYDNVLVRLRGGSSKGYPKKSFKFDFNKGHHLRIDPKLGRVEEVNLNTIYPDKAYLRQILAYETFREAGGQYCKTIPVMQQRNGKFYMLSILTEQVDEEYLERQRLDPNGALYKVYHELNRRSTSLNEKKTRKHESHADIFALIQGINQSGSARETFLWDNIDLPACINYWACIVLMHDNDCVHKNYYMYRDTEGDQEWRFLPWDKDLVFGRNYTTWGGVLNDTIWTSRDPQSHPLFGDSSHRKIDGFYNRLIHGMMSSPRIRAMYLRRLRSLMDQLLDHPSTPASQRYYEQRIAQLDAWMGGDIAIDQRAWGVPRYGDRNQTYAKALGILQNSYLAGRRNHLFNTHSGTGKLIPAQQAQFGLRFGFGRVEVRPASGNQDEQFVELINSSPTAVDVSGWTLRGAGIEFRFEAGTVVAASDKIFVTTNPRAFRSRSSGPRGGQQLFVVGPTEGKLYSNLGLVLYDDRQMPVTETGEFRYALSTSGNGDASIRVQGAAPNTQLFTLFSLDNSGAPGSGPIIGLGTDVLPQIGVSLGTAPIRVLTDSQGSYSYNAPAGTLRKGLVLTSRSAYLDSQNRIVVSEVRRVTF